MNTVVKVAQTPEEVSQCMEIRNKVFIEGQGVPVNEEIDGKDEHSVHFLLLVDDQAAGTARVRFIDDYAKVERVAILAQYRGQGLANKLMCYVIEHVLNNTNSNWIKLSSQSYVIPLYEKLGFEVCSDEYMDAGIPHKDMKRYLTKNEPQS